MDKKTKEALEEMNLAHLIETFAEKHIDFNSFLLLKEYPDCIPNVVPEIVDQLKLRKGLDTLHENNKTPDQKDNHFDEIFMLPSTSFISEDISVVAVETCDGKKMRMNPPIEDIGENSQKRPAGNYIREVLERSALGKAILANHQLNTLDNTSQCKLAELIINAEYGSDTNTTIKKPRFLQLAEWIVECLPGEYPETYYIPSSDRGKGRAASGKLYDAYTNLNKELRKAKLRENKCIVPSVTFPSGLYAAPSLPVASNLGDLQLKRKLEYLYTHLEPWNEVRECWEHTTTIRMNELRNVSNANLKVSDYINKYPILKQPGGVILLEHDFDALFNNSKDIWETKWPVFSAKLRTELLKRGLKEQLLDSDAALLYYYPQLFTVVPVKVKNRKPWRATRAEIQEGFIVHLKVNADLDKTLDGMRKTAQYRGTEVQPFAVIVGENLRNITSSYVVIDNIPIRVESVLRSVEVAFKVYHALYCEYPVQSTRLWIVLAKAVFGIEEEWQCGLESTPEVKRLIEVLRC